MFTRPYAQSIILRVFFSVVILFFSLNVFSAYMDRPAEMSAPPLGSSVSDWTPGHPVLTLYLQEYTLMPYVRVLVNGEVKGSFRSRYVTVAVQDGDSVSLDGTFYNLPVNIEVLDVSNGIISPGKGSVLTLQGNVINLEKVKISGH